MMEQEVETVQKRFLNFPCIQIFMKFLWIFYFEEKYKKGESVYTTLFGVCKVTAKMS